MKFNLGQLETLLWVVRLGSFRSAAAHLHVTQPAVSVRLRELEAAVGGKLFLRDSYRAAPTPLGREMAAQAERVIAACEELDARFSDGEELRGPIRIGVADSFAMACLAELMRQIEQRFPRLRAEIRVDFSMRLNESLQAGELSIAVLTAPTPNPHVVIESLVAPRLAWVASPKLALGKGPFGPADLAEIPIITNSNPSQLYISIMGWFAAAGVQPVRINTCNSLLIMTRLACEGVGITLVPVSDLRAHFEARRLTILNAVPKIPPQMLAVAYRRDGRSRGLATLAQMIHGMVRDSDIARYNPRQK